MQKSQVQQQEGQSSHPPYIQKSTKKRLHFGKEIEAMRKQVGLLQEKRFEGLMCEMDELRRERDMERKKVKLLKQTVDGEHNYVDCIYRDSHSLPYLPRHSKCT